MRALSMDLRERILAAVLDGKENMKQIAERFAVSYQVVQKLKYQWRDLGTLEPQTHRVGRKRAFSESQSKKLDELVRANASQTLEQLRAKLKVDCCTTTIWLELRRLGHSYKKTVTRGRARTPRREEVAKNLETDAATLGLYQASVS